MKKNLDENDLGPPFRAVMLSLLIIFVCAYAFCGCVSAEGTTFQVYSWDDLNQSLSNSSELRTVILMNDVEYHEAVDGTASLINIKGEKILDLNGFKINATDPNTANGAQHFAIIDVSNGGNLTVIDTNSRGKIGSIELTAKTNREWNAASKVISVNWGGSNVTINNGKIIHHGGTWMTYAIDVATNSGANGNANLTVNGGEIISDYIAIRGVCSSDIYVVNITINGGKINGNFSGGIWIQQGDDKQYSLTINDGIITGYGSSAIWLQISNSSAYGYSTVINGGTLINYEDYGHPTINFFVTEDTVIEDASNHTLTINDGVTIINDEGGLILGSYYHMHHINVSYGGKIPLYPSLNITEAYWVKDGENWKVTLKEDITNLKSLDLSGLNENKKATLELNGHSIKSDKKGNLIGWNSTSSTGNIIDLNPESTEFKGSKAYYPLFGYNVTFNGNGGTGTMDNQPFVSDASQKLNASTFKKDGYEFGGWATTENGAAKYANKESITIDKDTTLYAVWLKLYNINLIQSEGGNINADKQNAPAGKTVTLTSNPNESYKFVSWKATYAAGTITVTDNTFIMPADNVTVTSIFNYIKQYETGEEVEDDEPIPTIEPTLTAEPTPIVTPTQNQTVTPTPTQNQTVTPTPTQNQTAKPTIKPTPEPKTVVIVETEVKFEDNKVITSITVPEGSSGSITFTQTEEKGMDEWIPESTEDSYSFDLSCDGEINGESEIHFVMSDVILKSLGLTPEDVCLKHFEDGVWVKLKISYIVLDDGTYYYTAVTKSFSPFEITFDAKSEEPTVTPTEEQPTQSPMPMVGLLMGLCVTALVLRRK